ncbi:unnamed protein product [Sympodiomycopsis kandeliae]
MAFSLSSRQPLQAVGRIKPSLSCVRCRRRQLHSSRAHFSSSATPIEGDEYAKSKGKTSSSFSSTSSHSSSRSSLRQYGQPLPHSHPHLFPAFDVTLPFPQLYPTKTPIPSFDYHSSLRGTENASQQLTPGIPRSEYETRRRKLMDSIEDGAVVLLMGGRIKYMSGQIFYRFRQASNFWYLTGFQEPDSAVVLQKQSSCPRGYKMTMFVPPHDQTNQIWNGPRTGPDGAVDIFAADDALELDSEGKSLMNFLKAVFPGATKIYHDPALPPTIPRKSTRTIGTSSGSSIGNSSTASPSLLDYLSPGSPSPFDLFSKKTDFDTVVRHLSDTKKCQPLTTLLDKQRLTKSPFELRLMRKAGKIAGLAHNSTMRFSNTSNGSSEWALQSHFNYVSSLLGASRMAYVPVVAHAERGCVIHYTDNDRLVSKHSIPRMNDQSELTGDLVTMDAGVEYAGYTSDITRAWPASSAGSQSSVGFTQAQEDLYSALLRVLKQCTSLVTSDQGYSMGALHRRSVELLRVEFRDLGIELKIGELERILYPHYLSHHLGLDLHDIPSNSRTDPLKTGSTITIEPGLYIPSLHSNSHRMATFIPDHYRGIGMRIEDDVVVGDNAKNGPVVLTAEAVKEIQDVKKVCSGFWDQPAEEMNVTLDPMIQRELNHMASGME